MSGPVNGKQAKKHTIHALDCFGFVQILPEKVFKASIRRPQPGFSGAPGGFFSEKMEDGAAGDDAEIIFRKHFVKNSGNFPAMNPILQKKIAKTFFKQV